MTTLAQVDRMAIGCGAVLLAGIGILVRWWVELRRQEREARTVAQRALGRSISGPPSNNVIELKQGKNRRK